MAAIAGPVAPFSNIIVMSKIWPTSIALTHTSKMNGNLPPPTSNFGLYKKIMVQRSSGKLIRKYMHAAGAINGDAGASANRHNRTTPESTYIRYGIGGPAPVEQGISIWSAP